MSDYLGPNQTRVLDSTNRSFESITYQIQKPPLSSEVNLTGKIDAERNQKTVQSLMPSGWATIGKIKDESPLTCLRGDVACEPSLSNAFTFVAMDRNVNTEKNVAFVNGWRLVIQGSSSPTGMGYNPYTNSTENNIIRLPAPPVSGSRIDFVFLEVWRKLVTPADLVFQYGNINHGNPFTNDLIDPARGFETSLRVQLQYRIRVATIDDFDLYPEGFCPSVYVQGPLDTPITTADHANFTPVPGDPGLWIAGAGDNVAQEILQTVDGYTYAIPMVAIRRRSTETYDPRTSSNGNTKSLADFLSGTASDRPDNLYNDWIRANDVVDLRHYVAANLNLESVCNNAFKALQNNTLKTRMGYRSIGEESIGVSLTAVDTIAVSANTWSTKIASGDGSNISFLKSNAKGLSEVPVKFFETKKIETYPTPMLSIATKDQDIRFREGSLANAVPTLDLGDQYNMLRARGGNTKHCWDFGHQMIYHALGAGNSIVTVPRDMSGYAVLGIADIRVNGTDAITSPTISRSLTEYTVDLGQNVTYGNDVKFTLYTSNKYFETNKQGRGITDAYQMVEISPTEPADGVRKIFTLDTTANIVRPVLAVASYSTDNGYCFAYKNSAKTVLDTNNKEFQHAAPYTVTFPAAPTAGDVIEVPVLLRSPIQASESYAFFYEYIPYQGFLDTTAAILRGTVEAEGTPITTSAGSGAILDGTYTSGSMKFISTNVVNGSGTEWLRFVDSSSGLVRPRTIIAATADSTKSYNVASITSNTVLYLDTTADRTSSAFENYKITTLDQPAFSTSNIIDRLPTRYAYNDASGQNNNIANASVDGKPVLESRVVTKEQGFQDVFIDVGLHAADRGRTTVHIDMAELGRGTPGIGFEKLTGTVTYKKTFQPYIFNSEGKLYLMVIGSETDNTSVSCYFNPYSENDSVDLFYLPGRPLIANRDK